jgi:DNA-binding NarL/FixJ family response regulator
MYTAAGMSALLGDIGIRQNAQGSWHGSRLRRDLCDLLDRQAPNVMALDGGLSAALATLTPRERAVIERWYGLLGPGETYKTIAQNLRVSPSTVSEAKGKAMRKLRHPTRIILLFREFLMIDLPEEF